jgi:anti-sigma regulatory factor (Ser/Thr protein kinase)
MGKETTASVRYDLDGRASCVAEARRRVRAFLEAVDPPAGPSEISHAELITSELVSNAVQHAPGPAILWLSADGEHVRIAVTDSSVQPPVERPAGVVGDGHGGAGLRLVRALAGDVEVHIHPAGKTVSVNLARGSPSQTSPPRPPPARDPS